MALAPRRSSRLSEVVKPSYDLTKPIKVVKTKKKAVSKAKEVIADADSESAAEAPTRDESRDEEKRSEGEEAEMETGDEGWAVPRDPRPDDAPVSDLRSSLTPAPFAARSPATSTSIALGGSKSGAPFSKLGAPLKTKATQSSDTGEKARRPPAFGRVNCPTCSKQFARRSDFKRHERIHNNDRPWACDVCPRTFIQHSALTIHKRTHSGEKPHRCDVCPSAFTDSSSLARHRRIHTGVRPYICHAPDCDRTFCRASTLRQHIAKNHEGWEQPDVKPVFHTPSVASTSAAPSPTVGVSTRSATQTNSKSQPGDIVKKSVKKQAGAAVRPKLNPSASDFIPRAAEKQADRAPTLSAPATAARPRPPVVYPQLAAPQMSPVAQPIPSRSVVSAEPRGSARAAGVGQGHSRSNSTTATGVVQPWPASRKRFRSVESTLAEGRPARVESRPSSATSAMGVAAAARRSQEAQEQFLDNQLSLPAYPSTTVPRQRYIQVCHAPLRAISPPRRLTPTLLPPLPVTGRRHSISSISTLSLPRPYQPNSDTRATPAFSAPPNRRLFPPTQQSPLIAPLRIAPTLFSTMETSDTVHSTQSTSSGGSIRSNSVHLRRPDSSQQVAGPSSMRELGFKTSYGSMKLQD